MSSRSRDRDLSNRFGQHLCRALIVAAILVASVGCHGTSWLRTRRLPVAPLADSMKLFSWAGPQPTPRTMQWLRRYDLVQALEDDDPQELVAKVDEVVMQRRSGENVYTIAEIAFLAGKRAEEDKDFAVAFDMYGISVANAYLYLIDEKFDLRRNPYDPQFRQACDLYNSSLEAALRLAQRDGPLTPGSTRSIQTANQSIELSVVSHGSWAQEQIERIEFASDFESKGLKNQYKTFGLGVPLIAVFRRDRDQPGEQFYAPGMSVPATAFLRVLPEEIQGGKSTHVCTLELHDPLVSTDVRVEDRLIPLETDLTTPLAHSLSDKMFQRTDIGTRGMLNPTDNQSVQGIYLLEPYDPKKIPVLMVHGLWSSLNTWMEMFNDLRGDAEIRDNYQFWFYLYPTGQPFWRTAAQLRQDLAHTRNTLDPDGRAVALNQMVLVGHSMGGLVSRLQTLSSDNDFWQLISDKPFSELKATADTRRRLRQTWFFEPNPSIRRVVTIATPHRGSEFSNGTTQWLARAVIKLPEAIVDNTQRLFESNSDLRNSALLKINNSVESLSPASPVLAEMLKAQRAPWVSYHNIVGILPAEDMLSRVAAEGDGVVKYESAHLDDVLSETIVPDVHTTIHRHPRTVLEVQRILTEHLSELRAEPANQNAVSIANRPLSAVSP